MLEDWKRMEKYCTCLGAETLGDAIGQIEVYVELITVDSHEGTE